MNLIFDLDDTLYPEQTYIFQGFLAVAKFLEPGAPVDLYLQLIRLHREGSGRVFDELDRRRPGGIPIPEIVKLYRDTPRELRLWPGVEDACRSLKKHHRLVLITNGDSETQWKKVKQLGLESYFDLVLVPDDFGRQYWKPSVKLMNRVYDTFSKEKSQYIYIGNSADDYAFAREAGIPFILVRRSGQVKHKTLTPSQYQGSTISNISQLEQILKTHQS